MKIKIVFSLMLFLLVVLCTGYGIYNVYPALTYTPPKHFTLQEMNNLDPNMTVNEWAKSYARREGLLFNTRMMYMAECSSKSYINAENLFSATNDCIDKLVQKHWEKIHRIYIAKALFFILAGIGLCILLVQYVLKSKDFYDKDLRKEIEDELGKDMIEKIFDNKFSRYYRKFYDKYLLQREKDQKSSMNSNIVTFIFGVLATIIVSYIFFIGS